jgi:hypothetical protein
MMSMGTSRVVQHDHCSVLSPEEDKILKDEAGRKKKSRDDDSLCKGKGTGHF